MPLSLSLSIYIHMLIRFSFFSCALYSLYRATQDGTKCIKRIGEPLISASQSHSSQSRFLAPLPTEQITEWDSNHQMVDPQHEKWTTNFHQIHPNPIKHPHSRWCPSQWHRLLWSRRCDLLDLWNSTRLCLPGKGSLKQILETIISFQLHIEKAAGSGKLPAVCMDFFHPVLFQAGQYLCLGWKGEFHPFTLTSAPEDQPTCWWGTDITLVIHLVNGLNRWTSWTKENCISVHIRAPNNLDWQLGSDYDNILVQGFLNSTFSEIVIDYKHKKTRQLMTHLQEKWQFKPFFACWFHQGVRLWENA